MRSLNPKCQRGLSKSPGHFGVPVARFLCGAISAHLALNTVKSVLRKQAGKVTSCREAPVNSLWANVYNKILYFLFLLSPK